MVVFYLSCHQWASLRKPGEVILSGVNGWFNLEMGLILPKSLGEVWDAQWNLVSHKNQQRKCCPSDW
jgi:hypothetical protein